MFFDHWNFFGIEDFFFLFSCLISPPNNIKSVVIKTLWNASWIKCSFFSSVRVQDGFLTFRWWRSYVPKDLLEDLSHSDTRVSIQLNGFELHIYNRTSTYKGELFSDLVFYYQNCSDLLWEKIVLVIKRNFWNSRLKVENFQTFWDH